MMSARALFAIGLVGASFAFGMTGCDLIVDIDRSKIDAGLYEAGTSEDAGPSDAAGDVVGPPADAGSDGETPDATPEGDSGQGDSGTLDGSADGHAANAPGLSRQSQQSQQSRLARERRYEFLRRNEA